MNQNKINLLLSKGYSVDDIMNFASAQLRRWGILLIICTFFAVVLSLSIIPISRNSKIPINIRDANVQNFSIEFNFESNYPLSKNDKLILSVQLPNQKKESLFSLNEFHLENHNLFFRCTVRDTALFKAFHDLTLPTNGTLVIEEETSLLDFLLSGIGELSRM